MIDMIVITLNTGLCLWKMNKEKYIYIHTHIYIKIHIWSNDIYIKEIMGLPRENHFTQWKFVNCCSGARAKRGEPFASQDQSEKNSCYVESEAKFNSCTLCVCVFVCVWTIDKLTQQTQTQPLIPTWRHLESTQCWHEGPIILSL